MGKNGGSSTWFSAVKKAFRSPSKDYQNNSDKRSCRSEDLEQQEQEKKRGKRRWVFGKHLSKDQNSPTNAAKNLKHASEKAGFASPNSVEGKEKKRVMEVAAATAAAAEAAVPTAQAAVEFISMTRPCILVMGNQAAVTIQKAFRGYLSKNMEWDENQSAESVIESNSMAGMTQEAGSNSERDLVCDFSNKIWKSQASQSEEKLDDYTVKWREAIQWERPGRYSCDQRTPIKILKADNSFYSNHRIMSNFLKLEENLYQQNKISSHSSIQTPMKTHQPELKTLKVHSASPRCLRQEEPMSTKSLTPRLACTYRNNGAVPSYMAETASAKARIRSQSVPREQRPSTPNREEIGGNAKRRLFFGFSEEVASPSCTSISRIQR